ncbi:triggering receptor expressed on myeloid cells 1 [Orycteropus afer afer]|uniref:Triggering receptor expressed on myeloid cells 1 n=1 Tax=Orycteropus afer afer TaxID=1230840 RepID=A0AC54Z7R9_ORYAF|nr:triggering receptor expressed on myeloid cells 1 [Orycteropus afer afer]
MTYALSLKAWQRVRSQGPPEVLVRTETRDAEFNRAQAGRYLLEDFPTEAVVKVTVTGLQKQDEGLYQCVIDLSPQDPFILHDRIRLVHCGGTPGAAVSNKNPTQSLVETTTLPLTTTTTLRITRTWPRTTTIVSSPLPRVNHTNVEDVTRKEVVAV